MKSLFIFLVVCCVSLFNVGKPNKLDTVENVMQDTTRLFISKFDEYKYPDRIVIYFDGNDINYDSCRIEIAGDTMKVIKMMLRYQDLRNKQYNALLDVIRNVNNKKYQYYLKRYEALRDSIIK